MIEGRAWMNAIGKFEDAAPIRDEDAPGAIAYDADDDFARSIEWAYRHIRERMAKGGSGWVPK